MSKKIFLFLLPLAILLASCDEKESNIGVNLQDPATLYEGTLDSTFCSGTTVLRDSLVTSGQGLALIGHYSNSFFGTAEAEFYSQIRTSDNNGINFDDHFSFDSAILSLSISSIYPSDTSTVQTDLHFDVCQLLEAPGANDTFYAFNQIPTSDVCFFNGVVSIKNSDTMIADMKLGSNFLALLENKSFESVDGFVDYMKGIRIRLIDDGNPVMVTVNLAASATRLTLYYKQVNGQDTLSQTYEFTVGHAAPHCSHYSSNYAGPLAVFNNHTADTLAGDASLYLCPMGGTNVRLNMDSFVRQFHAQHPYAIIHYAELILPVDGQPTDDRPDLVVAFKYEENGTLSSIPDFYDSQTRSGYDGGYDSDNNCYRIRITQHLQNLLIKGRDYGTLLALYSQLNSPMHIAFKGCNPSLTGGNSVRIRYVYSE